MELSDFHFITNSHVDAVVMQYAKTSAESIEKSQIAHALSNFILEKKEAITTRLLPNGDLAVHADLYVFTRKEFCDYIDYILQEKAK